MAFTIRKLSEKAHSTIENFLEEGIFKTKTSIVEHCLENYQEYKSKSKNQ